MNAAPPRLEKRSFAFWSASFVLMLVVTANAFGLDELDGAASKPSEIAQPDETERDQVQPVEMPTLPTKLPDGRSLHPIGIYQSQMVELVPKGYRPASLVEVRDAIVRLTDRATDDQASRLRGSEYWIKYDNAALVSDRSVIDLESDRDTIVRRSLGRVNLAIEMPATRLLGAAAETYPRLESSPDGNLVAAFRGGQSNRTRIEFRWRLDGRPFRSGHEYTLRLPRTPQTRIVLSLPSTLAVESLDGVLRSRPGPPNDAGTLSTGADNRWYEIDAGGLSAVRLRITNADPTDATEMLVLRRCLSRYDIDSAGMAWSRRMVLQLPMEQTFPPLRIFGATITSIRVNDSEVNYTTNSIRPGVDEIQIDGQSNSPSSTTTATTVTVTGQSSWEGNCVLPLALWVGDRVVHAFASDEVQVSVAEPLTVVSWTLPSAWSQQPTRSIGGTTLMSASGPPLGSTNDLSSAVDDPSAWSQVRLSERSPLRSTETLLRLEADKGSLKATARLSIDVDPNRLEPFRVSVQPGFSIDSLTLLPSGRLIETPILNDKHRWFMVWPAPEDVSQDPANGQNLTEHKSQLILEAVGSRALSGNAPLSSSSINETAVATTLSVNVPTTWFTKVQNARGKMFASVIAPTSLNWSGEAALRESGFAPAIWNHLDSPSLVEAIDQRCSLNRHPDERRKFGWKPQALPLTCRRP